VSAGQDWPTFITVCFGPICFFISQFFGIASVADTPLVTFSTHNRVILIGISPTFDTVILNLLASMVYLLTVNSSFFWSSFILDFTTTV